MIKLTNPDQFLELEQQQESHAQSIPENLTQRFSGAARELVGAHMEEEQSFESVRDRFRGHLNVPETRYVPPTAVAEQPAAASVPAEVEKKSYATARGSAKAFAGGTALTGLAAFGTGALYTGALGASALAAMPIALGGGAALAGLYYGGKLHKLVWNDPNNPNAKEPGFWGTLARGTISGFSVPIGMLLKH